MSEVRQQLAAPPGTRNAFSFLWQRRVWWLLPLVVLALLIGIIYVLAHLSSADSEMYPTTSQTKVICYLRG
jgi:hypothetical protein